MQTCRAAYRRLASDKVVHLHYVPMKRQRVTEEWFELATLDPCGLAARGKKMGAKPVSRIALADEVPE